MRNLEEHEKAQVKQMLETKGFEIMEGLVKDYKIDVMNEMLSLPLGEITTIEKLTGKQNYLKGVTEFIQKIKGSAAGKGKKKVGQ